MTGLTLIGESINDSVPTTRELFDAEDFQRIQALAAEQAANGARYIDVNVGGRSCEFIKRTVKEIQLTTDAPLSIDSPDFALAEAGLSVYEAKNGLPILNSISPLRPEMFSLYKRYPFRPILLISEAEIDGQKTACHTAEQTFQAAEFMLAESQKAGIPISDLIFDPGIAPIGSDTSGNLRRLFDTLAMLKADKRFEGSHVSVGLSNFTVMLPPKRADGSATKKLLESAFLTKAMPLGLDFVIGNAKRKHELLDANHPAMLCLDDCVRLSGFESIMRVREFYR